MSEYSKETDVNEWLRFVQMDKDTAEHLFKNMYPKPMEIICYHCQQATEKALKVVMLSYGKEIIKTHDLGLLAELVSELVEVPENIFKSSESLTKYGVIVRYPQEVELTEKNVQTALANMNVVIEWCKSVIN